MTYRGKGLDGPESGLVWAPKEDVRFQVKRGTLAFGFRPTFGEPRDVFAVVVGVCDGVGAEPLGRETVVVVGVWDETLKRVPAGKSLYW